MSDPAQQRTMTGRGRAGSTSSGVGPGRKRNTPSSPSSIQASSGRASISPAGTSTTTGSGKVAIPRIRKEVPLDQLHDVPEQQSSKDTSKVDRTSHACEFCRARKTKCSGDRPICKHCRQFGITCIYADGKRDRARRTQEQTEKKVQLYEELLLSAGPTMTALNWARYIRAKNSIDDEDTDNIGSETTNMVQEFSLSQTPTRGENIRSASSGSMDEVDAVAEDVTNLRTRSTGFLGKTSEVDWQRNLNKKELDMQAGLAGDENPFVETQYEALSFSAMSYHMDDELSPDPDDPNLDIYAVPPGHQAYQMLQVFFDTVYPSFPFIMRSRFSSQLDKAYSMEFRAPGKPNDRWRALMNLVFAIASRYMQYAAVVENERYTPHAVYFARASKLGLGAEAFFGATDLQQIQIFGFMSFYLLSCHQVNRAWMFSSMACRAGIALGLHVENKDPKMTEVAKEARYRLWWALHGLDCSLEIMTGRIPPAAYNSFSTPLPVPYDERDFDSTDPTVPAVSMARFTQASYRPDNVVSGENVPDIRTSAPRATSRERHERRRPPEPLGEVRPSDALFLVFRTRLNLIIHQVFECLYQPSAAHHLWSQVQVGICKCNEDLDDWLEQLPHLVNFRRDNDVDGAWTSNRYTLAFLYYNTRIIINRPCLCEMPTGVPAETHLSKDFNQRSAQSCVAAAMDLMGLAPANSQPAATATSGPWWCMTHYVLAAVTILSIELYHGCAHMEDHLRTRVLASAKLGLHWLFTISQTKGNDAGYRAWRLASHTLYKLSRRLEFDLGDAPMPSDLFADPYTTGVNEHPTQSQNPSDHLSSMGHDPALGPGSRGPFEVVTHDDVLVNDYNYITYNAMFPAQFPPPDGYPMLLTEHSPPQTNVPNPQQLQQQQQQQQQQGGQFSPERMF